MPKTVVGLYNGAAAAQEAVRALEQAGFGKNHLRTTSRASGFESPYAVNVDEVTPDYLTRQGVPGEEAAFYIDGIRRGGSLVIAHIQDQDAVAAAEIMARHAPVDYEPHPDRTEEAPVPQPEGAVLEERRTHVVEAPEQPSEEAVETERVVQVEDVRETGQTSFTGEEDAEEGDEPLLSSVTVAESTDVRPTDVEDDGYLFADEGAYQEADVYEDDEDDASDDVAWLDLQDDSGDLTERLVTALLDDLRERIARLEQRVDDQAERLARLEQRAEFATERAQNAASLSAAKLETQLIERLTRLEELHRHDRPPEMPSDRQIP